MSRQPITLRNEDDLLALIPYTLGFVPEDSLVLVTLGRDTTPFHARIDLPDAPDDLPDVVAPLVAAARRNAADKAMVVVYTEDECLADEAADLLVEALTSGGVECLVSLRADGQRWYPLGLDHLDPRSLVGVPYDTRDHELTSRAVLDGRVTFRNRSELADSLAATDPDEVEEVLEAHGRLEPLDQRASRRLLAAEAAWLTEAVSRQLHGAVPLSSDEVARALRAVARPEVRDVAWCAISREEAAAHVRVWRDLVRRSPEELVAPAAGLLAFAAWLSGDGALAWCAIDRSLHSDPDHTLARLVGQALEGAVPPSAWRPLDPTVLDVDAG
ncbi:MAG TPA: DUF4192 domain-containing protein [Marmoricola sp.]|nr:DUF4192 domain-containing protein [Marmoricola sp.]